MQQCSRAPEASHKTIKGFILQAPSSHHCQAFRRHRLLEKTFNDEHKRATNLHQEAVEDDVRRTTDTHMGVHYQIFFSEEGDLAAGTVFANRVCEALADVPAPAPVHVETVLRLSWWNIPMVGARLSLSLKDMVQAIVMEITAAPTTCGAIVLLPNCPSFGKGQTKGPHFDTNVGMFTREVVSALCEQEGLLVVACSGIFDPSSLDKRSTRELRIEFLLVISASRDAASGEPISLWAQSALFQWRALPFPVQVMARADFRDWTAPNVFFDKKQTLHTGMERKQHFSGTPLLQTLITTALKGMPTTRESRLQLRDYSCYDDQMVQVVAELNGNADPKNKHHPIVQYVGIIWTGNSVKNQTANIKEAIADCVATRLRRGLPLGGVSRDHILQSGPPPALDHALRPRIRDEDFVVTCPRGQDLPIRQAMYDKWSDTPCTVTERTPNPSSSCGGMPLEAVKGWKEFVQEHDHEFNPSGVPFKTRRAPEEDLAQLHAAASAEPAAIKFPMDPEVTTEAECVRIHRAVKLCSSEDLYSFLVTPTGALYLLAEKDGTVPHDDSMFLLRGTPKLGAAGDAVMTGGGESWVQYKFSASEEVSMSFATPVRGGEFSGAPTPLWKALKFLDDHGYVRLNLLYHEIKKDGADPLGWIVTNKETAVLDVPVIDSASGEEMAFHKLGSYISIKALKDATWGKVVAKLQYKDSTNKISVGMPGVFPKGPVNITKGQIFKLL